MKRIKNLAVLSAVILSMIICFDDSISLFLHVDVIEMPLSTNCTDLTHHHHFSISDHFFQKNSVSDSNIEFSTGLPLFLKNQPNADQFQSSIWQPPQKNC